MSTRTVSLNERRESTSGRGAGATVAAGAEAVKVPRDVFWGGYSGYVRIPGGHLLELAYNPFWPIDDDGAVLLPGADTKARDA